MRVRRQINEREMRDEREKRLKKQNERTTITFYRQINERGMRDEREKIFIKKMKELLYHF